MSRRPLVFICHSSRDKAFVRDLAERLGSAGVDTWLDELEIRIGDSIHERINEGLSRSDFLIVVLSKSSVASRWVREELNSAASLEKLSERGVFILPVLLEECDVPSLLLDRRYANFLEDPDTALQELIDSISHFFATVHPDAKPLSYEPPKIDDNFSEALVSEPSRLDEIAPRAFEELIARLYNNLGYDVTVTPVTRDGGADVVARLSLPGQKPLVSVVECKRYSPGNSVGVDIVQRLYSAMQPFGAERGVVVTTSRFTEAARKLAHSLPIHLVDREELLRLLREPDTRKPDSDDEDDDEPQPQPAP